MTTDFELLVQHCVDGSGTEAEWKILHEQITRDPFAMDHYLREVEMSAALEWQHTGESKLQRTVRRNSKLAQIARCNQLKIARTVGVLVATVVVILPLIYGAFRITRPVVRASLKAAPATEWNVTDAKGQKSERHTLNQGDTLELLRGAIECELKSGVRVIIEAPGSLTLTASKSVDVTQGRLHFEILRESAVGFTVSTPDLKVIDLGTRFGMQVPLPGAHRAQQVHVLDGSVKVSLRKKKASITLKKGEGVDFLPGRSQELTRISAAADRFPRSLDHLAPPALLANYDFSEDLTSSDEDEYSIASSLRVSSAVATHSIQNGKWILREIDSGEDKFREAIGFTISADHGFLELLRFEMIFARSKESPDKISVFARPKDGPRAGETVNLFQGETVNTYSERIEIDLAASELRNTSSVDFGIRFHGFNQGKGDNTLEGIRLIGRSDR